MSDTVVPRTFPYLPGGGWRQEDIWGGPAGPGHDSIPDGASLETKERLKMAALSALDSLLEAFKHKVNPERREEVQRPPAGPAEGPMGPLIRIEGKGALISSAGWAIVIALGGLLLIGIAKERGISP